jgi:hypothetical protein
VLAAAPHAGPVPANSGDALYDAHGGTLVFQHRALFDVQLQGGRNRLRPRTRVAAITDALQFVVESQPVVVGLRVDELARESASRAGRCNHWHVEACALLTSPVDDLDRSTRQSMGLVKRRDHFQRGDDAEDTVEATAERHRVEVRANQHRRCAAVLTGATSEDIAKVVDANQEFQLMQPVNKHVAGGAIGVRQRRAGHATGWRAAQGRCGKRIQPTLHALQVDRRLRHGRISTPNRRT